MRFRLLGPLVAALLIAHSSGIELFAPVQTAVAQQASPGTATTTDRLNLRSGPALSYPVQVVIPLGATVQLTGQESDGFRSVTWNGYSGWAFGTWLSVNAPEPSPNTIATTTDRLNLRSGPGTNHSVITVLPLGAIVTLTGQMENGFRTVTWGGYSGWVSTDYLTMGSTPEPPPVEVPDQIATTTDDLNLRTGPGTTFAVIRVVPARTEVVLTGQLTNGFRSVSVDGTPGWMSADYLTTEGTEPQPTGTAVTTDRLNLRAAPNTSSTILTVIPNNTQVTLTGQSSNGFRSVTYGSLTGWAFDAYLSISVTTPPVSTAPFDVTNTIVGPVRGSVARSMQVAQQMGSQRMDQLSLYFNEIYRLAPEIGFDPAILVAQSALETDYWRSSWWINRLNPAGIGVTGDPAQNAASPTFTSGTIAARAQIAHMHAEVFGNNRPLPAILQGVDPTYQRVFEAGWAGTIVTISDLAGTWAVDPQYAVKIVSRAVFIFPS